MDIFCEIRKILSDILDIDEQAVTKETYLIRDLGAESIDLLEIAAALRTRFGIDVNEADIFLQGAQIRPTSESAPFLPAERIVEIAGDAAGGLVIKVKDLESYVDWKLDKERQMKKNRDSGP